MRIVNMVATGSLDQTIDLDLMASKLGQSYTPKRFIGLCKKWKEGTILLFPSGKYVISGVQSNAQIQLIFKRLSEYIKINKLMASAFKIVNIVAVSDVGYPINPEEIVKSGIWNDMSYEPEIMRPIQIRLPEGTVLLFSTGKMVMTGFTKKADLRRVEKQIIDDLEAFVKK